MAALFLATRTRKFFSIADRGNVAVTCCSYTAGRIFVGWSKLTLFFLWRLSSTSSRLTHLCRSSSALSGKSTDLTSQINTVQVVAPLLTQDKRDTVSALQHRAATADLTRRVDKFLAHLVNIVVPWVLLKQH